MLAPGPVRRPLLLAAALLVLVAVVASFLGLIALPAPGSETYASLLAAAGIASLVTAVSIARRAGRLSGLTIWGAVTLVAGQVILLLVALASPSSARCPFASGPCFSPFVVCGPVALLALVGGVLMSVALFRMASPPRAGFWVLPPAYPPPYGAAPWSPATPPTPPAGPPSGSRKCPRCGRESPMGAAFCFGCGERLG